MSYFIFSIQYYIEYTLNILYKLVVMNKMGIYNKGHTCRNVLVRCTCTCINKINLPISSVPAHSLIPETNIRMNIRVKFTKEL